MAATGGASFTAARVIVTVAAAEETAPAEAVTEKVFALPSFAADTSVRFSKFAPVITWFAVTLVPESFRQPVAGKVATVMLARAVLSRLRRPR
jgi:hypothetical protein